MNGRGDVPKAQIIYWRNCATKKLKQECRKKKLTTKRQSGVTAEHRLTRRTLVPSFYTHQANWCVILDEFRIPQTKYQLKNSNTKHSWPHENHLEATRILSKKRNKQEISAVTEFESRASTWVQSSLPQSHRPVRPKILCPRHCSPNKCASPRCKKYMPLVTWRRINKVIGDRGAI